VSRPAGLPFPFLLSSSLFPVGPRFFCTTWSPLLCFAPETALLSRVCASVFLRSPANVAADVSPYPPPQTSLIRLPLRLKCSWTQNYPCLPRPPRLWPCPALLSLPGRPRFFFFQRWSWFGLHVGPVVVFFPPSFPSALSAAQMGPTPLFFFFCR